MQTAERSKHGQPTAKAPRSPARRWAWAGLAGVLAGALALRLWGIGQGLPYVYNIDESDHFVPRAIAMFGHGLDPHYFVNPPGFTYLLHLVFAVWFGGSGGVARAYALHPEDVYIVARASAAVLGTLAIWLLYMVGARLFGRGVGLLAAALQAVAFLPVFYAHLALNDVPTLAPLTLSLLGTAGVLRKGRLIDYLVAGVGLGLACATKYTAGIALLPLAAAIAARYLDRAPGPARGAGRRAVGRNLMGGVALAGAGALVGFLLANPYAVLDFQSFHADLVHQSTASEQAQGKLGAPRQWGGLYYLWSLTWGLGWVPALAALGGAFTVWRAEARLGWLLVPAPLLFLAFMGFQGRYFGRWLLPIFPLLCLLAAFFALALADGLARRIAARAAANPPKVTGSASRWRVALIVVLVVALCGQGAVYSIHSSLLLSRADTRNLTRAWMVAHVRAGSSTPRSSR
jgi:4-amino-4-deoxy-L-arabinose transferase-like glycosyltransferase